MEISIGSVVVLKGGGPKMTVTEIHIHPNGNDVGSEACPICGPYPRIESSDALTMATMQLAQQTWRQRHDTHVDLKSHAAVTVVWMHQGACHTETFPIEAVDALSKDMMLNEMTAPVVRKPVKRRLGHLGDNEEEDLG
jgi:hypothetical protein